MVQEINDLPKSVWVEIRANDVLGGEQVEDLEFLLRIDILQQLRIPDHEQLVDADVGVVPATEIQVLVVVEEAVFADLLEPVSFRVEPYDFRRKIDFGLHEIHSGQSQV